MFELPLREQSADTRSGVIHDVLAFDPARHGWHQTGGFLTMHALGKRMSQQDQAPPVLLLVTDVACLLLGKAGELDRLAHPALSKTDQAPDVRRPDLRRPLVSGGSVRPHSRAAAEADVHRRPG